VCKIYYIVTSNANYFCAFYIYIYIYFLMSMKNNITQLSDPLVKVARRQLGHSPLVEFAGPL
jgi:hypothetical protein